MTTLKVGANRESLYPLAQGLVVVVGFGESDGGDVFCGRGADSNVVLILIP